MSMVLVSTVTVGSGGAAGIDFGVLPQSFTDLVVVLSARSTNVNPSLYCQVNGSGGTAYSMRWLSGIDGSVSSSLNSGLAFFRVNNGAQNSNYTANTFGSVAIYFPNYSSNSQTKSISLESVNENNSSTYKLFIAAGLWNNTSPITSIYLAPDGSWVENTTASLYGITRA